MVEAAKAGKSPPLPEQYLYSLCQTFGCLPSEIMEEDAGLIKHMVLYAMADRSVRASKDAAGDRIHKLPDGIKNTIEWLEELGINAGGL